MSKQTLIFILFGCTYSVLAADYVVRVTNDGPIVKGGTIHFYVTVFEGSLPSNDTFKYEWEDNAIPEHTRSTDAQHATDQWAVNYEADKYPMGIYRVQVRVKHCVLSILCYEIGSARSDFRITGTLNGDIRLLQKNKTVETDFVSNKDLVIHQVNLKKSDADYINKAPTVLTYWFVDCVYYGITTDFKFPFNYTKAEEEHILEALVMADFTPLPPTTTVAPTTTTSKPTTTTSPTSTKPTSTTTPSTKPTTTVTTPSTKPTPTTVPITTSLTTTNRKPDSTTIKSPISTAANRAVVRRSILPNVLPSGQNKTPTIMIVKNGKLVPSNLTFPYVCNGSQVATDEKKSYGFFHKRVKVRAPVSSVNVTGNNWIQQGDLLSLQVSCGGSKSFKYCVHLLKGAHNVTGNETCDFYKHLDSCEFPIKRYLAGNKYTIVIIIQNEVAKVVTPVVVTIYEVKKQAQLSVIVVPVAFSLVAVVLIVFGVAYYIQNRSRFVIEVADFNFGQQYSDMEYKTFRERLRDSITNAFTRGPTPSSSEVPVWPPGRK